MEIIATLPPPHLRRMKEVAASVGIDSFRLNTGVVTPYSPEETLRRILRIIDEDKLWIDIKGTQLRIDSWAVPEYSELVLNREIKVDLPATIYFRHERVASQIVEMKGRRIYVDPLHANFVGAGQAVNIHGNNYKVVGEYLMESDKRYIEAAKKLGVHNYMLSFLERQSDIDEVLAIDEDAIICGKIETPSGIDFCEYNKKVNRLMIARDDLFINCKFNAEYIFKAQKFIIERDENAIAASRLLISLENGDEATLADLADIYLLRKMGYSSFLLGDSMSKNPEMLRNAVKILRRFE